MSEKRDAQVAFRIPSRVYQELSRLARAERRTISDVVNNLLADRFPMERCKCGHLGREHGEQAGVCDAECSECDCTRYVEA